MKVCSNQESDISHVLYFNRIFLNCMEPSLKVIETVQKQALKDIEAAHSESLLREVELKFLGRKSEFNAILKSLGSLSPDERRILGPRAQEAKTNIQQSIEKKKQSLALQSFDASAEWIDVTLPGERNERGHFHVLSRVRRDIEEIFSGMGFDVADGPEIETEWRNFDALNIPKNHPARDAWDTFWLKESALQEDGSSQRLLLRTHTSPVQIRYMQSHTPPFRIIAPGRCFRREATDATHEHTFHQFEALVVGDDVNTAHFKYIGEEFFSRFFGSKVIVRLRPSFFPFTEPSFEFDISCTVCSGKKCPSCKYTGWLEVGGAGMVNQAVFEAAGYSRDRYQGFAWGFGLERLAMMKYKIHDIRLFHSGDIRFIRQF